MKSILEKCLKKQGVGYSRGEHWELNPNVGFSRKGEAKLQGVQVKRVGKGEKAGNKLESNAKLKTVSGALPVSRTTRH